MGHPFTRVVTHCYGTNRHKSRINGTSLESPRQISPLSPARFRRSPAAVLDFPAEPVPRPSRSGHAAPRTPEPPAVWPLPHATPCKRIAKASPSADNSAGAASGCFPAPPLLTALLFFAGAGFPAWSTNSSTTPSLIKSSAQPPGRISSPASVSRTLRNLRTSPSFSYSASSISISPARTIASSRPSNSSRLRLPGGSTFRCSVPAAL